MSIIKVTSIVDFDGNDLLGGLTAAGLIYMFAGSTAPSGFLKCNGASLSTSTYANLFGAIGYSYGGSGSNFNVPDMRGYFVRGWDDGRGVDGGRSLGSAQNDDYQAHRHPLQRGTAENGGGRDDGGAPQVDCTSLCGMSGSVMNFTGGNETKPRNRAMMFIISY